MSDAIMNKSARAGISVAVLVYCLGMMTWLVVYGNPENSLQQSAFAWCAGLVGLVLVSLSVVDGALYLVAMKKG